MKIKGKLQRGDEIIDEHVICVIYNLRKRTLYSPIFEGKGEIETSKPLPISKTDIAMEDISKTQYQIIFEPKITVECGIPDKIFINITSIDESRTKAFFDIKHITG